MRVRIHRGTKEIGGTCIELEAEGARLLLDFGLPLDGDPDDAAIHPEINGLDGKGSLLGLVLSHGHLDHFGLAHLAGADLPVALGAATHRILRAARPFVPRAYAPGRPVEYSSGRPFAMGPFVVTPHLVDHSAYDAHALEVRAGGKSLFYSGDFRGHGRKGALLERLIAKPPAHVDAMLMEGSSLGRLDEEGAFATEAEIENRLVEIFAETRGMALVAASAQNIDRMVSLYRACKRSGRTMVIDLYAAEMLRATENPSIPQSHWSNVAVYVPHYQRVLIKRDRRFDLLDHHRTNRIFPDQLAAIAGRAALLFRPAILPDLDRAQCLDGAVAVWSQWDGYLTKGKGIEIAASLSERAIEMRHAHTSGHASIADLKRLAKAVAPKMLVPVHTFEPERFEQYFGLGVMPMQDGEWWEI